MAMSETHEPRMELVPTDKERAFQLAQREATALAKSDLVPKEFRDNVANCMIAMNLAKRIGADPLMVMQNLDVIHGRPSFRATFLIACLNQCGRFTPLRYRMTGEGDEKTCVALANDVHTGEEYEGPPVSIEMAKAEGWSTKNGSKWKTMPDLMLRYRAAAFFARTTAPEVAMGLYTAEEIHDMSPARTSEGASAMSASEAIQRARDVTPKREEAEADAEEPEGHGDPLHDEEPPDDYEGPEEAA